MIYAEITPTAKVPVQVTPFELTTSEANYMSALARPYAIGSSKVTFEVLFGIITLNDDNEPVNFQKLTSSHITLGSEDISLWGTDDTVILSSIATKLGITASNFITIENQDRF